MYINWTFGVLGIAKNCRFYEIYTLSSFSSSSLKISNSPKNSPYLISRATKPYWVRRYTSPESRKKKSWIDSLILKIQLSDLILIKLQYFRMQLVNIRSICNKGIY